MRIRFVGHVGEPHDWGDAANDLASALSMAPGVELEVIPMNHEYGNLERRLFPASSFDALIVHGEPWECVRHLNTALQISDASVRRKIAYTGSPLVSTPPSAELTMLGAYDEIWTPSSSSAVALRHVGGGATPVLTMPYCYHGRLVAEYRQRRTQRPASERLRFYAIGRWTERVNHDGVLRAFADSFTAGDPVELLIHAVECSESKFQTALDKLTVSRFDLPMITLTNQPKTLGEVWEMHVQNDVYVSATRGEVWHRHAFDARLVGNACITPMTGDDFCAGQVASHAAIATWSAGGESDGVAVGRGGRWLEPDLPALGAHMRLVASGSDALYQPSFSYLSNYEAAHAAKRMIERIATT